MSLSPPVAMLALGLLCAPLAHAGSNSFCGGAATPGDPSDLANVVGDQSVEYAMQQPASMISCAPLPMPTGSSGHGG